MGIYILAIILAIINFIYIYGFHFDDLSEDQLVLYSPLWFLLFIFGIYGLVSIELKKKVDKGEYKNIREALVHTSKSYGIFRPFCQLFFFPLIFLNLKNIFLLSITSVLAWSGLLFLFFLFIFPEL